MTNSLSQLHIRQKIHTYLTQQKRSKDLIDTFAETSAGGSDLGHCAGISQLVMVLLRLEDEPPLRDEEREELPRDDFEWFEQTWQFLADWDEGSDIKPKQQEEIDRLINFLTLFHHSKTYFSIPQGELSRTYEYIGNLRVRREYSLGGEFTAGQWAVVLKELLQEKKSILIGSHNHAVGVYVRNGKYYFHNSNYRNRLILPLESVEELAEEIFRRFRYQKDQPSPLSARIFDYVDKTSKLEDDVIAEGEKERYERVDQLVKKYIKENKGLELKEESEGELYAGGWTGLHQAAYIGSVSSAQRYIDLYNENEGELKSYLEVKNNAGASAMILAARNGHLALVNTLLALGVNINDKDNNGITALWFAAQGGYIEVVNALLLAGADIHVKDQEGDSALLVAARGGTIEI